MSEKKVKTRLIGIAFGPMLVLLLLLAGVQQTAAQGTRFFRISGPANTKVIAFRLDGTLVWTNAQPGTNYTIQTISALPGGTNWVDYVQIPATDFVHTNQIIAFNPPSGMALIPAGSFQMGDSLGLGDGSPGERPVHSVYVSAFYMDKTAVTKALWDEVYNWAITHGYYFEYGAAGKAASHPAQSMTWYDAVKWCNARSEKEGRTPAYYTDAGQTVVYRSGQVSVSNSAVKWNSGYRLPTEAEWEKAARGGLAGQRFPWGNTISQGQANYYSYWLGGLPYYSYDVNGTDGYHPAYSAGGSPFTSPVGAFAANGYGLYDMAGNVWNWCWDWFDDSYYSSSPGTDPRGPTSGSSRMVRGSSWDNGAAYSCRSARRYYDAPVYRYDVFGFRSVLPPGQ